MSSDKLYALLDTIETDDKEDIENLLNDLDTEFIDELLIKNGGSKNYFCFQQAVWTLKTI